MQMLKKFAGNQNQAYRSVMNTQYTVTEGETWGRSKQWMFSFISASW